MEASGDVKWNMQYRIAYRILKALSHSRNFKTSAQIASDHDNPDRFNSYDSHKKFLEFVRTLRISFDDKSLVDIGCGTGDLTIKLAKEGAKHVVGIDIDEGRISSARKNAEIENVEDRVDFVCCDFNTEYVTDEKFDIAISSAAFEHILDPIATLRKANFCLKDSGLLVTIFGPLWLSPYGAHMREFTNVPWVHLLFPENIVLKVRSEYYRPDEIVRQYEDVRGHLNRITVKKFKHYVERSGFDVLRFRLNPGLDNWNRGILKLANMLINAVPIFQELCSFQLLAVLIKRNSRPASD